MKLVFRILMISSLSFVAMGVFASPYDSVTVTNNQAQPFVFAANSSTEPLAHCVVSKQGAFETQNIAAGGSLLVHAHYSSICDGVAFSVYQTGNSTARCDYKINTSNGQLTPVGDLCDKITLSGTADNYQVEINK